MKITRGAWTLIVWLPSVEVEWGGFGLRRGTWPRAEMPICRFWNIGPFDLRRRL